ncbi:hypothetical protein JOF29_004335 [Kribbella aluminosa]|uniref:Relaxase/mobilization nuclease-like protein n=1 Tax=Kribbella aluminosa TaxID=416017 RepID=A0ABS4UNN8_9ACTN|nr:hypothetical protein [Kribbella aluminosa]MBP2353252.1 hypothetical protein [Kribbella aluminosa]
MNRREAGRLVGTAWLDSDYRVAWETRIMRRRVPLYRAGIAALRGLNAVTGGRPSLQRTRWERVGPHGGTFVMDKLETMTGRTDHPVTSRAELRARTSFASRLARAISADEWPQMMAEYDRRRRGERPQYHYVGHRPLNTASHALMDEAWVRGELPTDEFRAWNVLKHEDDGAFYSEFFTHGNARGYPGGETNPGFRLGRISFDVSWRDKATLALEHQVLRRSRALRAKELLKFLRTELHEAIHPPAPIHMASASHHQDAYTPEVVAAVAEFAKPNDLRSPTARGETVPNRTQALSVEVANAMAHALPPPHTSAAPAIPPRPRPGRRPGLPRQPER